MSQAQHASSSSNDDALIAILAVIGVLLFLAAFYWFWKPEYFTLKMYQFRLLDTMTAEKISIIHEMRNKLDYMPLDQWSFGDMVALSYTFDYLIALPMFFIIQRAKKHIKRDLFLYLRLRNRELHVTDRDKGYNALQRIGDYVTSPEKAGMFDLIKPIWGLNLLDIDPNDGGWATARKPHDIAARFGLFKEAGNPNTLDEAAAERYFMMQIGKPYLDEDSLSDYHKAILGVVLALMERKANVAEMARNAIARSFDAKQKVIKPDFSAGVALFEEYKNSPIAAPVFQRHAYVNTLMYGMFKYAKEEIKVGVLVAHYFIWLKPIDRVLFYTLNNEGSKVEWTECAGAVVHASYEIGMNQPLYQPYTKDCITAYREECLRVIPEIVLDTTKSNSITVDGVAFTTISDEELREQDDDAEKAAQSENEHTEPTPPPVKKSLFVRFWEWLF